MFCLKTIEGLIVTFIKTNTVSAFHPFIKLMVKILFPLHLWFCLSPSYSTPSIPTLHSTKIRRKKRLCGYLKTHQPRHASNTWHNIKQGVLSVNSIWRPSNINLTSASACSAISLRCWGRWRVIWNKWVTQTATNWLSKTANCLP